MSQPTDAHVSLACQVFLAIMMRESMRRNPGRQDHSVPAWTAMSMTDRATLQRAMKGVLMGVAQRQAEEAKQQPPDIHE